MKEILNNQEIPIPEGLEQRLSELIDRLEAEEQRRKARKTVRLTRYALAAAACILLLLVFRFSQGPVEDKPVIAETIKPSIPQPAPQPVVEEKQEEPQKFSEPATKANRPQKPSKTNKPSRPDKAQPEPMLAEAEPMPEEAEVETEQEYRPAVPDPIQKAEDFAQDVRSRGERLHQEIAQLIINQ